MRWILLLIILPIAAAENTTFIAIGHVYPDYVSLQKSIPLINAENPDFVVFLGDSIKDESSWNTFEQILGGIEARIILVPGNHEHASTDSTHHFQSHYQQPPFVFSHKGNDFLILDSENIDTDFIRAAYETPNEKIIFMHHCLFSDETYCNGHYVDTRTWDALLPEIAGNTLAVFVGDSGENEPYFAHTEQGLRFYGVGFSTNPISYPPHLLRVTISDDVVVQPLLVHNILEEQEHMTTITHKSLKRQLYTFTKDNSTTLLTIMLIIIVVLASIIIMQRKEIHHKRQR